MRESRLRELYIELAPGLTAFAALIGRSFEAQAVIAFFNAILSAIAFHLIGIENELMLCTLVFMCSFIPVLGVILSGVPVVVILDEDIPGVLEKRRDEDRLPSSSTAV